MGAMTSGERLRKLRLNLPELGAAVGIGALPHEIEISRA
jgi:hypothetical protein